MPKVSAEYNSSKYGKKLSNQRTSLLQLKDEIKKKQDGADKNKTAQFNTHQGSKKIELSESKVKISRSNRMELHSSINA